MLGIVDKIVARIGTVAGVERPQALRLYREVVVRYRIERDMVGRVVREPIVVRLRRDGPDLGAEVVRVSRDWSTREA